MEKNLLSIEIPHNENIYREQLKNFFFHRWKNGLAEIRRNVIYLVLAIIALIVTYLQDGEFSTIFIIVVTIFATILYVSIFQFFKEKKNYYKKINETIFENKAVKNVGLLNLSNKNISFRNNFVEHKSIWEKTSYEFAKDMLIINFDNSLQSFLFEEREIGKENFENLINIVKEYSKEKK